jgi:hypothetical protein
MVSCNKATRNGSTDWWPGLTRKPVRAWEFKSKVSVVSISPTYIIKVMGHGTVGYCFDSDPELGGTGYLIGLHRCQSYKIMQRKENQQTVDPESGKRKQKGNPLKYNRGDLGRC